MPERERKLIVGMDLQLPSPDALVDGLGSWAIEEIDQDATYFDTDDLRLTRAGVSLRHRSDEGWLAKLPEPRDGETFVRHEQHFAGDAGQPPTVAIELVRAWARSSPLREVARIRTRRRKLHVLDPGRVPIAEIDDDRVTATAAHHLTTEFREIEVELAEETEAQVLDELVGRLLDAGVHEEPAMSKVARALGARASEPPDLPPPPGLEPSSSLEDLVRASITGGARRLVEHDWQVRAGDAAEPIHQARVATRRLRSDLKTFRPLVDETWSEPLRAELKWLGELLGRVRDADVLHELLERKADGLGSGDRPAATELLDRLSAARDRDRGELLDALRGDHYTRLLDDLVSGARSPRLRAHVGARPASKSARTLARRPWKRLRKDIKALRPEPADADLHEVRKRAKQARYALEAVAPVAGPGVTRAAKRLADLQDVLGDHQDAVVASTWLGDAAQDANADTAFVAGRLAGGFDSDKAGLRRVWRRAWKQARRRHRHLAT